MKRTMVYLPDDLHKNLKRLAVEQESSLASLVREAVETLYREDMADLAYAQDFLKGRSLGRGKDYRSYRTARLRKG